MARQYLDLAQVYGAVDQSRANQAQLENNRLQQQRLQRQMEQEQRAQQEQEAIRGVYRGAIETDETGAPRLNEKRLLADLYGVAPEQALRAQEGFAKRDIEAQKLKSETAKAELAQKVETSKYLRDRLATVRDQAGYEQVMSEAQQMGAGFVQSAPKQFNPDWVNGNLYNADDFIKKAENELNRGVTLRGQDLSSTTARRGQDISALTARRGQDITASNAAQRLAFDRAGGVAAVNAASGVTAKPEKFTEGMRNNAMYAQRMTAAEKLMADTYEQKPSVTEKAVGILGETAANATRSPDRQKALQAQRDWVRAKLRKESGAAIGVDEMNQEINTYFPQIGDSTDVIEQKKIAREQATQGLIQSAGGAYSPPMEPAKPIMSRDQAQMPSSSLSVTAPNGKVYNFKSQAQANEFKRQAGIK